MLVDILLLLAGLMLQGTMAISGDIRLVGDGAGSNKGRVEVLYNGKWLKVCSWYWDIKDASVACRQLGFAGALEAGSSRTSRSPRKIEGVRMYRVSCRGNESSLNECSHRIGDKWNPYWCFDADVLCLSVRLVGGQLAREGLVQVYYSKTWGWVCANQWDKQDADVACRMMGFEGSLSTFTEKEKSKERNLRAWLDNIQCNGIESSLFSCVHDGYRAHGCEGKGKAGVICKPKVRLVSWERKPSQGRVEVLFRKTWGAVCGGHSADWNVKHANMVCRELGLGKALSASKTASKKLSDGSKDPIKCLHNVRCRGNEDSLSECYKSWNSYRGSRWIASVECSKARLLGGKTTSQGLVQVNYNNNWGWVCADQWDRKDADVACRMMGFDGSSSSFKKKQESKETNYHYWLNNMQCNGNERYLSSCIHGLKPHNCEEGQVAGAVCKPKVRLVAGGNVSSEGRVEVFYNGTWGSVCSHHYYSWDLKEANVVCRQLGFPGAVTASSAWGFGRKQEGLWLRSPRCVGNEASLTECYHSGWAGSCYHGHVGVICAAARLVGGQSPREGLVQVSYNKTWSWVCADQWDKQDADVACRMMGFDGSLSATFKYNGNKENKFPMWLNNMHCVGNERSLLLCPQGGSRFHNREEKRKAGVICRPKVRLVGWGNVSSQGRVEVFYNDTWGTVCGDNWDLKDAKVVCRQLGFKGALAAVVSFAFENKKMWLSNVRCVGNETSIAECGHSGWGKGKCDSRCEHRRRPWRQGYCLNRINAGVVCIRDSKCDLSSAIPTAEITRLRDVRLVDGNGSYQGRVEVLYDGEWGTVCDHEWSFKDANVVCRQLGFEKALAAKRSAAFGRGKGKIWMSHVRCTGDEKSLTQCDHERADCSHSDDAGVVCMTVPAARLVEGQSTREGLVQVYYNKTWGWVCADKWDKQEADVACRMMGFPGSLSSFSDKETKKKKTNLRVWLNNMQCFGNESSLFSCIYSSLGDHVCDSRGKAGAICRSKVRVVGEENLPSQGRVEVFDRGVWKAVCDSGWDVRTAASVVCRELGFGKALTTSRKASTRLLCLYGVRCMGNEDSIIECEWYNTYDRFGSVASVECSKARLLGGKSTNQGLVQVNHDNTWGWVCADQWDKKDADVVCRMMGFDGSLSSFKEKEENKGTTYAALLNKVRCYGNENTLFSCIHDGSKLNSCEDKQRAGATCRPKVRLVADKSKPSRGRVEVFLRGNWQAVCGNRWDRWNVKQANVVCRELGFGRALTASKTASRRNSCVNVVRCMGDEDSIFECEHSGWYNSNYRSDWVASVECSRARLTSQELIQVNYNNNWGWVCADQWDKQDADVACRMMGFDGSLSLFKENQQGQETKYRVWFNNMKCTGNERSLFSCAQDGLKPHDCEEGQRAGATCTPKVRLVAQGSLSSEGRVEVFYNETWGSVCSYTWDIKEANVVCRQLGFPGAVAATSAWEFWRRQTDIWLNSVSCVGNEASLTECYHSGWRGSCYYRDASVVCTTARLVEGQSSREGLVQVYYNKTWGWVCADYWDKQDADVTCRMMGFDGSLSATFEYKRKIKNKYPMWLNSMHCVGNERSLFSCPNGGLRPHSCEGKRKAGVVCRPKVRLVGWGNMSCQGRVEVFYNETWGTVCDDHWNLTDAKVVCRQLGFEGALVAAMSSEFGAKKVWLSNVRCAGNETSIAECDHSKWGKGYCRSRKNAGVVCIRGLRAHDCKGNRKAGVICRPGVRLIGGGNVVSHGRVEVYNRGIWEAVCSDDWDLKDANVVCRQLGFEGALTETKLGAFGRETEGRRRDGVRCTGVRFVGEKTSRKGLVQVYYNKTWGWVCADQWNKQNADVACRMMGFNGSLSTGFEIQNSKEASITSWMNNLQCTGKESSLLSCVHDKQRSRECTNGKIAWTTCKERKDFQPPDDLFTVPSTAEINIVTGLSGVSPSIAKASNPRDSRSQPYLTAVIVLSCFVIIAIPCMSFLFWKLWRYFQDARDNTKAKKKDTEVYEEHYVPSIPRERGETLYFELRSRAPQGQVAAERHYEGLQHNDCPDYQNINDEKIYGVYDEIGKIPSNVYEEVSPPTA